MAGRKRQEWAKRGKKQNSEESERKWSWTQFSSVANPFLFGSKKSWREEEENKRGKMEEMKVRERESEIESDGKGGRKDKELDFQIIEERIELKIELNPIISLFFSPVFFLLDTHHDIAQFPFSFNGINSIPFSSSLSFSVTLSLFPHPFLSLSFFASQ